VWHSLNWRLATLEFAGLTRAGTTGQALLCSMAVGAWRCRSRVMLAEKLLGKSDYDCDREFRTLELLKLRFGEGNLHDAEIMIKVATPPPPPHPTLPQLCSCSKPLAHLGVLTSSWAPHVAPQAPPNTRVPRRWPEVCARQAWSSHHLGCLPCCYPLGSLLHPHAASPAIRDDPVTQFLGAAV
jgi:hypothetical protein